MPENQANFVAQRISNPFLQTPAPKLDDIEYMIQAANRAPDHGNLSPFRFIVVNTEHLEQLGELFLKASANDLNPLQSEKILNMPKRAPMVIISIVSFTPHPKAPKSEQLITAGLAVHQLCLAAKEIGFDSMWRTGALAYNQNLFSLLNLAQNEEITGFIYIGTAFKTKKSPPTKNVSHLYSTFGEHDE
ncbi:MAG: nitroreductase [Saccharospirillaceae bacterium]|nr:nitroreductase [Pseudomonadales bacterium]NRB80110.1 nitroreductase [Saccharospirillaceae bacterium]